MVILWMGLTIVRSICSQHTMKRLFCLIFTIMFPLVVVDSSECMGKTFHAATTNTWELFDHRSLLQSIFLISANLNFHRPLVCSTICDLQEWSMVKNLSCVSCAGWNVFPINSLRAGTFHLKHLHKTEFGSFKVVLISC